MAEAARACSNRRRALIGSWVTPPTTGVIEIERGGDENITINHGCGGGICGGGSNSGGDDGGGGGDGGNGGGRESDGGVGCGRADDDGGYGGGKSDNVTTVTGTVAMGLAVAAVAKATMMTLCQCTRVKRSTTQVAVAVAAVDGEDGVQWRRWGGTFENANPNEVHPLPMLCRLSLDESI